jgi:hypothetical protein
MLRVRQLRMPCLLIDEGSLLFVMPGDDEKPLHLPDSFESAERFQRLFVVPMVESVKNEVKTFCDSLKAEFASERDEQKQLREDVNSLKGNQKKALLGYGVWATALSAFIGFAGNWLKNKIGIKS